MKGLDAYEKTLLLGWEEIHKKSQLTLWILLGLKDGPKHMAEIKLFISDITNGLVEADDQSMYRALRRFHDAELVRFSTEPGDGGPDRKVYELTRTGRRVLRAFSERNIIDIFDQPRLQRLIKR